MNFLFYIIGFGLAGRIASFNRKYRGDRRMFDYSRVFITINEYKDKFSYYATCICNDVSVQGLSNSPYITIFKSGSYKTQIEAESNLEKQVRFAGRQLKKTKFYLTKPVDFYEDEKLIKNVCGNFEYKNAKWINISEIPQNQICQSCGHQIEINKKLICNCGEYILD